MVRTENVEDSPLSIQRSRSAGGVRRRNVEREGSHSRKDGNPLGWLAIERGARGRGFGRSNGIHFGWKKSARSQGTRVVLLNQTKR